MRTCSGVCLYSASLDQTCRVFELSGSDPIHTIVCPSMLHSVVTDPQEHRLYLGGGDGRIFEADLHVSAAASAAAVLANAAAGRGDGDSKKSPPTAVLEGHGRAVCCMCICSGASELLVSGDEGGVVLVWDTASRQLLRRCKAHEAAGGPITALLVLPKRAAVRFRDLSLGKEPAVPLVPLKKYCQHDSGHGRGVGTTVAPLQLRCTANHTGEDLVVHEDRDRPWELRVASEAASFCGATAVAADESGGGEAERLKRRVLELETAVSRWQSVANTLFNISSCPLLETCPAPESKRQRNS